MKKKNIEVEGGELLIQSKEGHYAVIPAKHRQEVMDMVKDGCDDCINNYIQTLPKDSDYAPDGSLLPDWDKVKTALNPYNWGVPDYSDKGDFGTAYSAARKAGEKEFMWNNKRYSTNYKGTPQQQLKETGITDNQLQNQNFIQDRLYKNLYPYSYEDQTKRVFNAVVLNEKDNLRKAMDENNSFRKNPSLFGAFLGDIDKNTDDRRMDAYNIYMGYPQKNNTFSLSQYKPTVIKDNTNQEYFKINDDIFVNNLIENIPKYENVINFINELDIDEQEIRDLQEKLKNLKSDNLTITGISRTSKHNKYHKKLYDELTYLFPTDNIGDIKKKLDLINQYNTATKGVSTSGSDIMGNFQIGFNKDNRGDYVSYYDKWDIEPKDFGKPFEIYDRIYIKDYGDGQKKRMYYSDKELSELDVNKKNFDTLALQRELSNRDYNLPKSTKKDGSFDGVWGEETKNALIDWQNKNKPKPIVDKATGLDKYSKNHY